jgi:hypothetical protein
MVSQVGQPILAAAAFSGGVLAGEKSVEREAT